MSKFCRKYITTLDVTVATLRLCVFFINPLLRDVAFVLVQLRLRGSQDVVSK